MLTHIVALSERSSARRATKVNFDNWIGFYMTRNTSMQHYTTAIYIMFCCWMAPPPISRVSSKSHTSAQKRCRYMLYNTWQDTKATAVGIGIGDKSPRNLFFFFFFFSNRLLCNDVLLSLSRLDGEINSTGDGLYIARQLFVYI